MLVDWPSLTLASGSLAALALPLPFCPAPPLRTLVYVERSVKTADISDMH
jgi:hypothetical protein